MEPQAKPQIVKLGLPMTFDVWRNAKIDFGASMMFSIFNVVLNQFYVAFAIQEGASNVQVGLLAAAPAIGLLFSPIWASIMEKSNNPKPFVILPNLIGRLLLLLPALFHTPSVYVAVAIVFQLLMGIQAPAYAALVSRIYPANVRGRLMGYVRVSMGVIMIPLAYIVGGWAERFGPSGPLIAAALIGTASILLFNSLKVPNEQNVQGASISRGKISFRDQWKLVSGNRILALFLAATTLSGFGNMLAIPLYQIIQVEVLELTNIQIGYTRVTYFVALLLTFLIAGWMIDRIDIRHTLLIGIGAFAVVPLLYGLWGTYSAVLVGNAIQGVGEAIWDIGILAFVLRIAPGREAVVFGLHLLVSGIRGTVGPLLSTSLTTNVTLTQLLIIAALFGWIGTLLFYFGNRNRKL